MRVVVADDAVLIREGLVRLLEEFGCEVVAAVGTGDELVRAVVALRPDVSVVDVRMPPTFTDEGLRAAVETREKVPGAPVLILSQYVEVSYADDLLADARGAVGYLLKDRVVDVEEFMDGLRRVAGGGTVFDPQVVAQLMVRRRRDDPLTSLTPREREVLGLMAEGRSNPAISRHLVVTEGAVEKHITGIFQKLGLHAQDADQHRRVLAVLAYLRS
ncbi:MULTISPECIES: response regulator transcription factor [Microtetraspora]|uniref:Response regulator transcription factor n=1 Tax=Microtetraspora glauca TaxID=1996 RepID=A0ABV3G9Z5_MICGL|nr:response regulator transcription factor [Microtetraspora sp. AC03309]MCC5575502.1 response regulator transcription factor [Microtetraspora sp. AC03309]